MKISVNIPSYKRPKVVTLGYLPFCNVWVDNKEYEDYLKANHGGGNIIAVPDGVQGNVCRIRNYILEKELPNNDVVVIVDDDMEGIYRWQEKRSIKLKKDEVLSFIERYSILAEDWGVKFWGINVNHDKQNYREYTPFSTVSYIPSPFMAFMGGNEIYFDERFVLKEDYDMTLMQLSKYRVVLRLNKYFCNVKQHSQVGGCASYRNFDKEIEQLKLLQKKWGSKIVQIDYNDRSHKLIKSKGKIDFNPLLFVPIKGV